MIVRKVTCRTIINKTGGYLSGFTHTINPYHGCAFGRTLCGMPDYAPGIVRSFGEEREWGTYLDVKVNARDLYVRDYDRIRARTRPEMRVYMSSVTDPYVPHERRYRITRGILEAMFERPPDLLALQTHTPNPLWDEDLLSDLSLRFPLSVQISVETDRETLGPFFPRHAYPIKARIAALRRLRDRGVASVAVVSPIWPVEEMESFARRLEEASTYVVLDHYLIGDGTSGARTRCRMVAPGINFPDLLVKAGWEEWTRIESLDHAREVFTRVFGEDRVGISKEGFFQASHRLLAPSRGAAAGQTEAG